jgi:hypothetical protein
MDADELSRVEALYSARTLHIDSRVPGYAKKWCGLTQRLLSLGGVAVVQLELEDPDIGILTKRGCSSAGRVVTVRGRDHECHANTAALFCSGAILSIVTGYALSDDGLWRQHSWGISAIGDIVESTTRREHYYGVTLKGREIPRFTTEQMLSSIFR